MTSPSTQQNEMRKLLTKLVSFIALAFILALFFIYPYASGERMPVDEVLIAPQALEPFNKNHLESTDLEKNQYYFDRAYFEFWNPNSGKRETKILDPMQYQKFYEILTQKSVLSLLDRDIESFFRNNQQARLQLFAKKIGDGGALEDSILLQTVEFANQGDYFRVQRGRDKNDPNWLYFRVNGIYLSILMEL